MRLIYLIGTYPEVTTTFIDREIRALQRWGVAVTILSIRRPPDDMPLSSDQQQLQRSVTYLFPLRWLPLLASHVYFLLRRPLTLLRTLFYLLTRPHPSRAARLKTLMHASEGLYTAFLVRQLDFSEFHAHFADRVATVALVAGRLLGKPYSLSIHAGADIYVDPILLKEKITHARHAVTCTAYNKIHLEALIGEDLTERMTCIYHGLDLAEYKPSAQSTHTGVYILSVGQLAPRKGFADLIQACGRLKDLGVEFHCEIVGQGPQRPELESLIAALGLQAQVTLCGALPHEAVIEKYRQAAMFVLPCIQTANGDIDGIPNVLLEAMAMQVPVISTRLSAIPELIQDQVNGLLVPPGDPAALTSAMALLLYSPALRAELGRNGRQTAQALFDVECNVRTFAGVLWPAWFQPSDHHLETATREQ